MLRVYRIPLSTNVERVALAAGAKGVEIEWVDVDPADRSPVSAASGQDLVPVLEAGGLVVADSARIVEWLDHHYPEPPLFPREPARRAEVEVFVDWFNGVWKGPPNRIAAELDRPQPDAEAIAALGARMTAWLDRFEALLGDRDWLMGGDFGAADVMAFPFVKYGRLGLAPGDDEIFHRVLVEWQPIGERHPRLVAWIDRVDALPRA